MRVYVLGFFVLFLSLVSFADDDDHEVRVVGDKNYTNNATLVYDGIDVSNYQKDINWEATAKDPNIKYVYIKATEGATHRQHRYRQNLENARRHGVKVGSYHFLRTSTPIQRQFENFISVVRPEEQDLVPLLDVETREGWTIKQLQDSVLFFAQLLEKHYGCKPMIYTNSSYFNNYLGSQFAQYPLFIARYAKSEPQLNFGARWILWQFSDRGRIDGIDAMVDLSRFNKGCGIKDIAYKNSLRNNNSNKKHDRKNVPRPKVKQEDRKPDVPYPKVTNKPRPMTKEEQEIQKRGEEAERKRMAMEEKRKAEERKALEKQRKEEEQQRKEIEKRQREIEKRRTEEAKKREKEERKRLEEEKKKREQEERKRLEEEKRRQKEMSLQQAQDRMRAEKDRRAQNSQQEQTQDKKNRQADLEQAKQERRQKEKQNQINSQSTTQQAASSDNEDKTKGTSSKKGKYTPKGNNQSSADNDAIHYNKKKKNVW